MNDELINRWIREDIRELSAYPVPNPGNMIKLDAMENPYTWPQDMQQEWLSQINTVDMNRYPDPTAKSLRQKLETVMQVPQGMVSVLGNGSDELIQIICLAVSSPGRVVMAPEPTFVMYSMIARFTRMEYQAVPLDEQFRLDMPAMLKAIEEHQPAVIFLAYPNNPTGNLFAEEDIRTIIDSAPGLVVVDEAYHAFADNSFMSMLNEYDNLLVMRTVSKMGLAGLRLGILSGPQAWINEFDKIRLPYNINVLTQFSAEFALWHSDILKQQTDMICQDRESLKASLNAINGIKVFPSAANFILFKVIEKSDEKDTHKDSAAVFESLKQQGVLIKRFADNSGVLANCLRVTVGTAEENQIFLRALAKALNN
jgi:histidinol-phosphate aminotransferase